jgi:hypothetical protein
MNIRVLLGGRSAISIIKKHRREKVNDLLAILIGTPPLLLMDG